MAERHKLQESATGVSTSAQAILGPPPVGRGYLAVSSENITDEMIQQYIEEQEGEPVADDSRFQIDSS
jgi:hypothetical protein